MSTGAHLRDRRDDWEDASSEALIEAVMSEPRPTDPFFHNWVRGHRPHVLRRALLLHRDLGGFLGPEALRFLKGGRR